MKPINLIPILLLSLIFFGFDDPCAVDSPQLTHNCRGVRPDAPTGNPSTPNFYYHPWLEYSYQPEMQGPLPPNQGTDDYEILFHATGPYENSMLGFSLCSAGDQNGDGYDDIVAYCDNPPELRLYFGGDPMDTIPDMIFPMQPGDWSGLLPTELADLNGDGGVDIVIEWEENWQYQEVYVFYGGTLLDTIVDLILTSDNVPDLSAFGYAISCGDLNGDGQSDLAIGAPGYIVSVTTGKIFIYYGGTDLDSIPDFEMTSAYNNFGSLFGGGLSISGDINNDGFNDIISRWNKASTIDSTGIYLFNGNYNLDSIPDWTYSLPYFSGGYNVFSGNIIKDLNNDGYDEIAISTMYGYSWQVHLFFGGETMPDEPDLIFPGGSEGPRKIKTAGDINADGFNDMIMGSGDNNWVRVYFGGNPMDNSPDITFYMSDAGFDVGSAGDVNNDGIHDFMFSVVNYDFYQTPGEIFIYSDPSLIPHTKPRFDNEYNPSFILEQNFPNPFNSVTIIPFQVNQGGKYELNIYNIIGQDISSETFNCSAGENVRILWDGKDISGNVLPSGLYFAELMAGDYREAIKMEILR